VLRLEVPLLLLQSFELVALGTRIAGRDHGETPMGRDVEQLLAEKKRRVAKLRDEIQRDERKLEKLLARLASKDAKTDVLNLELEVLRKELEGRRQRLAELLGPPAKPSR
jgi:hypothetical protein